MKLKDLQLVKVNKKEIIESVILYTTTLIVTIGMLYLLFPSLLKGLSEVKRVNTNVVVMHEKLDSIKSGQDYVSEKVDGVLETNFVLHDVVMDSIKLLNRKIDAIQRSMYQTNRISNQNIREIQSLKRLYYQDKYSPSNNQKVTSLDNLFRKDNK
jgi:hypothetical protein